MYSTAPPTGLPYGRNESISEIGIHSLVMQVSWELASPDELSEICLGLPMRRADIRTERSLLGRVLEIHRVYVQRGPT